MARLPSNQGSDTREPKRYAPKPNRFRGRVYILMDGASASTASEFLAVAHANKVGVFVGEESGGAYEGANGSSFINLELPRSGHTGHYAISVLQQRGTGTEAERTRHNARLLRAGYDQRPLISHGFAAKFCHKTNSGTALIVSHTDDRGAKQLSIYANRLEYHWLGT